MAASVQAILDEPQAWTISEPGSGFGRGLDAAHPLGLELAPQRARALAELREDAVVVDVDAVDLREVLHDPYLLVAEVLECADRGGAPGARHAGDHQDQVNIGCQGLRDSGVSAVLEGAIFGDHCSPISDTSVLSSVAAGSRSPAMCSRIS